MLRILVALFFFVLVSCRPFFQKTAVSQLASLSMEIGEKDELQGAWLEDCQASTAVAATWTKKEFRFFNGGWEYEIHSFNGANCADTERVDVLEYLFSYEIESEGTAMIACKGIKRQIYNGDLAVQLGVSDLSQAVDMSATINILDAGQSCSASPVPCSYVVVDSGAAEKLLSICHPGKPRDVSANLEAKRVPENCCENIATGAQFKSPLACASIPANCKMEGGVCGPAAQCVAQGANCISNGQPVAKNAEVCRLNQECSLTSSQEFHRV